MIPKFSDAVTIDWERRDFAFKTVLTVRFCASMQYHIEDGDEVEYEKIKDLVVEQLRLEVANSVGGMLATAERETLERRIDELCTEVERLKGENDKLRKLASELYQQVLQDDAAWHDVRAWEDGLPSDCLHPIRSYDDSLGMHTVAPKFEKRMRELGIEALDGEV